MTKKEQREKDRDEELARQERVRLAVEKRNEELAAGKDPDPNVGTGWYPGEAE
jgi:hypothetical protein